MAKKMPTVNIVSDNVQESSRDVDLLIQQKIEELSKLRGTTIYPLFLTKSNIDQNTVDDVFEDLREKFTLCEQNSCTKMDVILESSGGSIDAAYNIALLLRRYAQEELNFIIPRWAKSAATVIACAGDKILMTPVAELGPVDPQIAMMNQLEKRFEQFSPLHIDSTLTLIREEFKKGHQELAQGLLGRLQFPLTLGGIRKSLDIGTHYIDRLLSSRMLKKNTKKSQEIAYKLVHDYATHAFCIEIDEVKTLGLKAELLPNEQTTIVWEIRKLFKEKDEVEKQKKQHQLEELIKQLPPELLKSLPFDMMKEEQQNVKEDSRIDIGEIL